MVQGFDPLLTASLRLITTTRTATRSTMRAEGVQITYALAADDPSLLALSFFFSFFFPPLVPLPCLSPEITV